MIATLSIRRGQSACCSFTKGARPSTSAAHPTFPLTVRPQMKFELISGAMSAISVVLALLGFGAVLIDGWRQDRRDRR